METKSNHMIVYSNVTVEKGIFYFYDNAQYMGALDFKTTFTVSKYIT